MEPVYWAAKVSYDSWDMTEADTNSPPLFTDDIESMYGWSSSSYTNSISGMFEGTVSDQHLSDNRMTLELSSSTIDGDDYYLINLIGKFSRGCDVYLHWTTTQSGFGSQKIGELSGDWGTMGVHDLSSNSSWDGKTIDDIWLSFKPAGPLALFVRIVWIKLENGEL